MGSIKAPYLFRKRGIFYLRKRIPKELIGQYGRAFVQKSLRTSDRSLAVRLSGRILDALEHEWRQKLFEMPAERPWRRLKTNSSKRIVPLVGEALWAVNRAAESTSNGFLFPKYCNEQKNKADSASGALGKWLKPRVEQGQVVHSFRHTYRDRLRNAGCPFDIQERLGGWSTPGVGNSYGQGYGLEVLHHWMSMLVVDR